MEINNEKSTVSEKNSDLFHNLSAEAVGGPKITWSRQTWKVRNLWRLIFIYKMIFDMNAIYYNNTCTYTYFYSTLIATDF